MKFQKKFDSCIFNFSFYYFVAHNANNYIQEYMTEVGSKDAQKLFYFDGKDVVQGYIDINLNETQDIHGLVHIFLFLLIKR